MRELLPMLGWIFLTLDAFFWLLPELGHFIFNHMSLFKGNTNKTDFAFLLLFYYCLNFIFIYIFFCAVTFFYVMISLQVFSLSLLVKWYLQRLYYHGLYFAFFQVASELSKIPSEIVTEKYCSVKLISLSQ